MFSFKEYLQLSREVRELVTQYWCAYLKTFYGVSSVYQLKKALLTKEELSDKPKGWLNRSSRFFNRKEAGEPIAHEYVIDEIDQQIERTTSQPVVTKVY